MLAIEVNVNTTEYEFSHGHLPKGRGCWMFELDSFKDPGTFTANVGKGACTYGEAKKQAITWAKKCVRGLGVDFVTLIVMP